MIDLQKGVIDEDVFELSKQFWPSGDFNESTEVSDLLEAVRIQVSHSLSCVDPSIQAVSNT